MNPKLSIYQGWFGKNVSTQYCLLLIVEEWRRCLENKGSTGVILTGLSKPCYCLICDLLIAK